VEEAVNIAVILGKYDTGTESKRIEGGQNN
jgi:hypothetical protein